MRAGEFFLPTSRENRGNLWTSPYAITFSTLNQGESLIHSSVFFQGRPSSVSHSYW